MISTEGAVLAQHVVAGDEPRDRVGADGLAHRPSAAGQTYGTREQGKAGRTHLDEGSKKVLAEIIQLMKPYFRA